MLIIFFDRSTLVTQKEEFILQTMIKCFSLKSHENSIQILVIRKAEVVIIPHVVYDDDDNDDDYSNDDNKFSS
jgi:hypothetical protein